MKNPIPKIVDETSEILKDAGTGTVRELKDIGKIAKAQVTGNYGNTGDSNNPNTQEKNDKADKGDKSKKKTDPVTGKPVPTKQQLSDLKNQTAQLQMAKLKKIREELEAQRLKVTDKKSELAPVEAAKNQGKGPAMPTETAEKAPDNAVANTLKGSKSTGEFKGLVGG